MKLKDLRKLTREERLKRLLELKLELIKAKSIFLAGKPQKNVKLVRNIKKEIARILTIEREEELKKKVSKNEDKQV
jgi:large subunit ribosomal protein L29